MTIALAKVKVGNTSDKLLHEIWQIVHLLYQAKEINRKVYNNVIKSLQN